MKNEQMIAASAFTVMGTGVLASVQKTNSLPNSNFWIGIAIAYFFIALLGQFAPDVGNGFSIVAMVAALLINGEDIGKFVGSRTGGKIGTPVTQKQPPRVTSIYMNPTRVV